VAFSTACSKRTPFLPSSQALLAAGLERGKRLVAKRRNPQAKRRNGLPERLPPRGTWNMCASVCDCRMLEFPYDTNCDCNKRGRGRGRRMWRMVRRVNRIQSGCNAQVNCKRNLATPAWLCVQLARTTVILRPVRFSTLTFAHSGGCVWRHICLRAVD